MRAVALRQSMSGKGGQDMESAELYLDWSRLALEKLVAFALSPDACGYFASGLVLATFWMHRMVPLRMVAIASNVAFFSYAMMLDIKPVAVLHALLLPVNIRRLCQLHANPWGKVAEVGKKLGPLAGYAALVGVVTVLLTVVPGGTVADGTFRCAAESGRVRGFACRTFGDHAFVSRPASASARLATNAGLQRQDRHLR